jgi:hypothetical protein
VQAVKKPHERDLGSLNFTAGQTSTLELPRNYSFDRLKFRLIATLYRAAGASAGAPMDLENIAQLVNKIEIRKNGREVLKAIDFATLCRLCELRYGTPMTNRRIISGSGAEVTTEWDGFAAVTTGANAIEFELLAWLDFGMWNSIRRNDSLLDTTWRGGITTLDLVITWGQYDDVMTSAYDPAAGGVAADVAPVLQVSTDEYIDPDAQPGEYIENREYGIRKTVTATDPKFQHRFNIGNRFRSFVVKTYSDDVLRNDILNNVKIMSGSDVYKNRNATQLRQENKGELHLETMPTGYYVLEFCKDGHLSRAVDTQGLSDLTIEMDVTKQGTTCIIEIFPVELVHVPITAIR